jgi:hypothetical protein
LTKADSTNAGWNWTNGGSVSRSYTHNRLNQTITNNDRTLSWTPAGNMASDGVNSFTYDADNRLTGVGPAFAEYDAVGRLRRWGRSTAGRRGVSLTTGRR